MGGEREREDVYSVKIPPQVQSVAKLFRNFNESENIDGGRDDGKAPSMYGSRGQAMRKGATSQESKVIQRLKHTQVKQKNRSLPYHSCLSSKKIASTRIRRPLGPILL